jgi:hypothetical protein
MGNGGFQMQNLCLKTGLLISVLFVASCGVLPKINCDDAKKIQAGMAQSEVEGIMGTPYFVGLSKEATVWGWQDKESLQASKNTLRVTMNPSSKIVTKIEGSCMQSPSLMQQRSQGIPFNVTGERIDIVPPADWKLAFTDGDPNGEYFVEYIPNDETITSWKKGYLFVGRKLFKDDKVKEFAQKNKKYVVSGLLVQSISEAEKLCPGKYEKMSQITNIFNEISFAVGGGYCGNEKFGEGAFVAFAVSDKFIYKIHYGWCATTESERSSNLPWRISEDKAKAYLEAIKAATLCDNKLSKCKNEYITHVPTSQ